MMTLTAASLVAHYMGQAETQVNAHGETTFGHMRLAFRQRIIGRSDESVRGKPYANVCNSDDPT